MRQMHATQPAQSTGTPTLRRERAFTGANDSIREARRWPRNWLPPCEARDDLEAVTHELAMNAVQHTASGAAGGTFGVDLSWWRVPDFVRVVVEDRGGPLTPPHVIWDPDGERSRGLLVVRGYAAGWGVAGDQAGRWVWADIPWAARGGPPLPAPDDDALMRDELTVLRQAFGDTRVWLDHSVHMWCGKPDADSGPPVCAPSPRALAALLTAARTAGRADGPPQRRGHRPDAGQGTGRAPATQTGSTASVPAQPLAASAPSRAASAPSIHAPLRTPSAPAPRSAPAVPSAAGSGPLPLPPNGRSS